MSGVEQQAPATGFDLIITPNAAEEVRKFMTAEQVPEDTGGLRVSVLPGGCSGFKYSLNIEERALEDDMVMRDRRRPGLCGRLQRAVPARITIDYVIVHAGLGVHVQQPERHRRMRVRQQLHGLSGER